MEKSDIYLDTSVLSAYFDMRKPARQLMTQKWFQNDLKNFLPYMSTLVLEEINDTPEKELRDKMLNLAEQHSIDVFEINDDIYKIAAAYRKKVIPDETNDSIHLAVGAYNKMDAIVSWNFKHIVNLKTIQGIHEVNRAYGLAPVEIITIENLGGDKYGSL